MNKSCKRFFCIWGCSQSRLLFIGSGEAWWRVQVRNPTVLSIYHALHAMKWMTKDRTGKNIFDKNIIHRKWCKVIVHLWPYLICFINLASSCSSNFKNSLLSKSVILIIWPVMFYKPKFIRSFKFYLPLFMMFQTLTSSCIWYSALAYHVSFTWVHRVINNLILNFR